MTPDRFETATAVRLTLDEIRNPPIERFVLGRTIPLAKSSVFYGPTGVGKSGVIAQLAFALAAGAETLWGVPLLPGGGAVLVFSAEDSLDDWRRKAAAVLQAGDIDMERAIERLYIMDASGRVVRLSEMVTVREGDSNRSITRHIGQPTNAQEQLISTALAIEAKLIIIETTSLLVDEEDNPSFAALNSALARIARETGGSVVITHHVTKAASKDGDSSIESARGGGALIANARNALSLFPAEAQIAERYASRFPADDVVVLAHQKSTSSTRRQTPVTLVRCETAWGAVFRLPDETTLTPQQQQANAMRLIREREREQAALIRLYVTVEKALRSRPSLSPSYLRNNFYEEIGVPKNGPNGVEALVTLALERGVLKVASESKRGITVALGSDPRVPPSGSASRAGPGESPPELS